MKKILTTIIAVIMMLSLFAIPAMAANNALTGEPMFTEPPKTEILSSTEAPSSDASYTESPSENSAESKIPMPLAICLMLCVVVITVVIILVILKKEKK